MAAPVDRSRDRTGAPPHRRRAACPPASGCRPRPSWPSRWAPAATRCARRSAPWSLPVCWTFAAATAPTSPACGPSCCSPASAPPPTSCTTASRSSSCRSAGSSSRRPPRLPQPHHRRRRSTELDSLLTSDVYGDFAGRAGAVRRGVPPLVAAPPATPRWRRCSTACRAGPPGSGVAGRRRGRRHRADDLRARRDPRRSARPRPAARRGRRPAPRVDHRALVPATTSAAWASMWPTSSAPEKSNGSSLRNTSVPT